MSRLHTGVLCLLMLLALTGCGQMLPAAPIAFEGAPQVALAIQSSGQQYGEAMKAPGVDNPTPGLQFQLSEGSAQAAAPTPLPRPSAEPLSPAESDALLSRLPALPVESGDVQELALPPTSLPPPRTGVTVQEPFPPPATPPPAVSVASQQLEVLRYAPEGDVPLAANLSVTFNQPMVPITGIEDLKSKPPPVRLSPLPPGQWRWIGTSTLVFEPVGRFPMATLYTAEVPAGTTSASGARLTTAVKWTFTTPPPKVLGFMPVGEGLPLDPLMAASFDQRIEPADVLESVKVTAGSAVASVRLATAEEINADPAIRQFTEQAGEGRWLVFRAKEPFPADAQVAVVFSAGTPSAEGPLKTSEAQTFVFRVHGPLEITEERCGWENHCPPLTPWFIEFSNPLDVAAFEDAQVQISPELPGAVVNVFGATMQIQGATQGRTEYQVRLSGTIRDVYEQTLGDDQTVTFKVGEAEPAIWAPGTPFVVLDPTSPARYSVFTINFSRLSVKAYAVTPRDWEPFQKYLASYYQEEKPLSPPGELVLSRTINIRSRPDQLTETAIDLEPALNEGLGQLVLVVEPETTGLAALFKSLGRRPPVIQTWIQSTQIALDAFVDHAEMIGWSTSLKDGSPLAGVELQLLENSGKPIGSIALTDRSGVATLPLPKGAPASMLVGRKGPDLAILMANVSWWGGGGWAAQSVRDSLRWHVYDDRGIYRPGEEVHIKGWIRRLGGAEEGDVEALEGAARRVSYRLLDPQGNQVGQGSGDLSGLSGFDLAFTLPDGMNLGAALLELTAEGGSAAVDGTTFTHSFQVQEFRRPEFEVKTSAMEGPYFVEGSATVEVSANYYAGGALSNAETTWQVTSRPGSFSPPGWDDFTFGTWTPWWIPYGPTYPVVETAQTYVGRTDASGIHRLEIDFLSVDPPAPTSVTAQATVMDVNRQAWSSQTPLLVHPASLYVGLRSETTFVEREEPLRIDAIVTDLDGVAAPDTSITMRAGRLEWRYKGDQWVQEEVTPQTCTIASASKPVQCTFETPVGGEYRITAEITDPEGRRNRSQFLRWVSGGDVPPARNVEQEQVILIPDHKEYQPGDVAEILVQAPFRPAEGILTTRRSGIVSARHFTMDQSTAILKIPIEDGQTPNLYVQVDLAGSALRLDAGGKPASDQRRRPAFASGQINLAIPPLARTLAVGATPRDDRLEPGGETSIDVAVLDAAGKPVRGAEVAVVVVDEAVLALTAYQAPDPIATFYTERSPDATDYRLRSSVVLGQPEIPPDMGQVEGRGGGPGETALPAAAAPAPVLEMVMEKSVASDQAANAGEAAPIAMRSDFNPLAVFAPEVMTDENGKAVVPVKLPDNLTRYRVMVTAVAGDKYFGKGESSITARLPLMARPSAPRFLNFGDQFELPVVLQNQTDAPMTVDVAVRATNIVLAESAGLRVTVPANDRVEVRFPAATAQAGTARFQVAAASDPWSDAAQFSLPVWTPATTEAFASYGVIDRGAVSQPIVAPTNVYTQFGSLDITTSSTALQELTDAVLYLANYPFECSEQLASRILSVSSLRDVLSAFQAEGLPSEAELNAAVARDIKRLSGMQNDDGGFGLWRRGDESWPYHSIHAANALQTARAKGYTVSDDTLSRSLSYLQSIESHIPSWYGAEARRSIIAYALNVRWRMSDPDAARARALIEEAGLEKLSFEAIGWILPVLSDDPNSQAQVIEIRRYLNNRVRETAGAAHFVTSYGDDGYLLLHSERRVDGIVLDSLIIDQPDSELIPKLVRGLLNGRDAGRWANTQENVFILLALDRYFRTYESVTPDFVARMWLGGAYVGEAVFQGRSTDYRNVTVPMSYVAASVNPQDLILSKEGEGRLYYRMGLNYAPRDLNMPPAEYGFSVERTYEAVDNPADVKRDATGVWLIKAGAQVRIKLTMVAPSRRYHVALVDPLPAGLEALNPALAVTGSPPPDPSSPERAYSWWWGPWYEHQNLRDDRAEAFTSYLWDGVYNYVYYARATTPGQFVVPPAKAEEMYAPETFGRSATDRVIVQ